MKFKDFSRTFQDLFEQIQGLFQDFQDLFEQIQGLFQDFPGPFRANSRTFPGLSRTVSSKFKGFSRTSRTFSIKFRDFSRTSRTFSSKFKDPLYQWSLFILCINPAMSFTRFTSEKKARLFYVLKHCYVEGIMSRYDKQLILIILRRVRWKTLPTPGVSRTVTQIQGLNRARNFSLLPIPGLSRIFEDRGNPVKCFFQNRRKVINTWQYQ